MFSSNFHSLTNLRGFKASTTMPKASCFADISRTDWSMIGNTGNGNKHLSINVILDKNMNSPKHPQPDNC